MGWLVLFPFYFFSALTVFLALTLLARLARLKIGANQIATTAVILALGVVVVPLALDHFDVHDYSGRRMMVLAGVSLVLALIDTILQAYLPLPLDRDLAEF